jgi:hypothetical protein
MESRRCDHIDPPQSSLQLYKLVHLEINVASFCTPLQPTTFKNITPWGHIEMKLIKGWFLWSLHPSEMMDTHVSTHVSWIDCSFLCTDCLFDVNKVVWNF